MGRLALMALAAFTVYGITISFNTKQSMLEASDSISEHQYEVLARNTAVTGYNVAKQALAQSFNSRTLEGRFEGGTYKVTIIVNGNMANIVSVGSIAGSDQGTTTYTIQADYQKNAGGISSDPPAFMSYALLAEDDLELSGDILSEVLVTGEDAAELNANMHTNGDLYITGTGVDVRGFGTYVGTGAANPASALLNSFMPNYNPTSQKGSYQVKGPVEIPVYDVSSYSAAVSFDKKTSGNVNLSGEISPGGTRDKPFIWFIDGNLTATGNTTVNGYVMFIVDGNIELTGNVSVGETGYTGPDESSTAFYAKGSVELGGSAQIYGQIYAGGDVVFMHGTPRVYGSITTLGKADLRGTPKIYYREASPALTTIWEQADEQISMLAYSEW